MEFDELEGNLFGPNFPDTKALNCDIATLGAPISLALDSSGQYLAVGYRGGFVEIRTTADYNTSIRTFRTGAPVKRILALTRKVPSSLPTFALGSANGLLHTIQLGATKSEDIIWTDTVSGPINAIAYDQATAQLAVAFNDSVSVLEMPRRAVPVSRFLNPEGEYLTVHELPFNLHYFNGVLLVVYVTQALAFSTKQPFQYLWRIKMRYNPIGGSALSSDGLSFYGLNMVDGIDEYSTVTRRGVTQFRYLAAFPKNFPNRVYNLISPSSNGNLMMTGQNQSVICVLHGVRSELHNIRKVNLNPDDRSERCLSFYNSVHGIVNGRPTVFAINGEGEESTVYIVQWRKASTAQPVTHGQVTFAEVALALLLFCSVGNALILFHFGMRLENRYRNEGFKRVAIGGKEIPRSLNCRASDIVRVTL
ncbi:hypothetical protein GALMADRAFT_217496 [Galerina marginata CBS 339.88]|uniref:Cleavage/polyadenylation specificity factor A subunit N-terminal domain-containing protein n=1 Tax=Galerina marginata (strain CBS 339.88) TaxID=685588 RepID=A0A067S433_GALM3|nr:hypothetical protein GALMADRAFT_217496 [Galerina marginata CBS 339.88]